MQTSMLSYIFKGITALSIIFLSIQTATSQVYYPHTKKIVEDVSGPYGYPSSIHGELGFLGIYEDHTRKKISPHLTKAQWTEIVLNWWAAERADPSETKRGLGGGPIDTHYIRGQMINALYYEGDPLLIDALVASRDLKNEEVRTGLRILLCGQGDRRQLPFVHKVITEDKNPEYREQACAVTYDFCDPSSLPILDKALRDPYYVIIGKSVSGNISEQNKFYPVRERAKDAIRALKARIASRTDVKKFKIQTQQIEEIKMLLPHAEEYRQENAETIKALAEMFNR